MTDIIDNSLINSTVSAEAGGGFSYEAVSLSNTGNKLRRVDDGADSLPIYAGAPDFPDGVGDSREYEYDPNGNLTRDDNRGYTAAYNLLNLPAHIKGDDGTIIRNYYDTSGTLLRRTVTTAFIAKTSESAQSSTLRPSFSETVTDDYVGDLVFTSPVSRTDPPTIRVVTPTGFIDTAGKVHSHVRDYQGNVRQVLDEEGNVEQSSDYYPYGMLMGESDLSATSASPNPFRFGGKHYLTAASIFLHDFAARFYDAALITFTSHDAITSNSYPTNPFLYCNADPINYIDPTGMDTWVLNTAGELLQRIEDEDKDVIAITNGEDMYEELEFEYGTVKFEQVKAKEAGKDYTFNYFTVRGDEKGTQLFEFMADNCTHLSTKDNPGAEFSLTQLGTPENGPNVISTSSEERTESSFGYMFREKWQYGYNFRAFTHSHPTQPGDLLDQADSKMQKSLYDFAQKKRVNPPKIKIYHNKNYYEYNYKKN